MVSLALVIENDASTRKLLDVVLTRFGYEVDAVANGDDALVLLAAIDYDMIVVDVMVPGASGEDLLQWLAKERPAALDRCLVISSAPKLRIERIRASFPKARVIRKPFELQELMDFAGAIQRSRPSVKVTATDSFARRSVMAGAKAGLLVRKSGARVSLIHQFGYTESMLDSWFPLAASASVPLCQCMRDARPQWLASLAAAEPQFPQLANVWRMNQSRALATVPLFRDGEVLGAAGWSFREPQAFDEREQRAFMSIADDAAEMLDAIQSDDPAGA